MSAPIKALSDVGKVLVITADDFGYSAERDAGILEAFQTGAVTQATLLVQGHSARSSVSEAEAVGLPLGLHLNLTEGWPVAGVQNVPSLVGEDGLMLGKMGFREALLRREVQPEHIQQEIEAQVDRFQTLVGKNPSFVDGHQHVHILPGVRDIVAVIMTEADLSWVRIPVEPGAESCPWLDAGPRAFFGTVIKDGLQAVDTFTRCNIRFSHRFIGLSTMGGNMTVERLSDALSRAFSTGDDANAQCYDVIKTCELMTHPGYPCGPAIGACGDGPDDFAQSNERIHELRTLQSDALQMYYKRNCIKLLSIQALVKPKPSEHFTQ